MKLPKPHVDELRETEDVFTANTMLKDGWILLEIIQVKRGPLYIMGKRILSAKEPKGTSVTVVRDTPPALNPATKSLPQKP